MLDMQKDKIAWSFLRGWARFRRWRRAANVKAGAPLAVRLNTVAEQLDLPDRSLPNTRDALYTMRGTVEALPWGVFGAVAAVAVMPVLNIGALGHLAQYAAHLAGQLHLGAIEHGLQDLAGSYQHLNAINGTSQPAGPIDAFTIPTLMLPFFIAMMVLQSRSIELTGYLPRRYVLNAHVLAALELCAEVQDRTASRRQRKLRALDRTCRRIERSILSAHRASGTIPRRSTRRRPAKQHAALVAGILRQQLAHLDTDPGKAITDLSRLLATIGENYASGRVSALVDVEAYPDAQPLSTVRQTIGETVRVAVALTVATATAAFVAAVLPKLPIVPEQARTWVIFGCAAVAALLTSGWSVFSKVVGFIPGKS